MDTPTGLEPGMRVRRRDDGRIDRIQQVSTATSLNGHRFEVVIIGGVVYLPREWELVEEEPDPTRRT